MLNRLPKKLILSFLADFSLMYSFSKVNALPTLMSFFSLMVFSGPRQSLWKLPLDWNPFSVFIPTFFCLLFKVIPHNLKVFAGVTIFLDFHDFVYFSSVILTMFTQSWIRRTFPILVQSIVSLWGIDKQGRPRLPSLECRCYLYLEAPG